MGLMDKAKKVAEQAQAKLDEAQGQFNERQSGGGQGAGPVVQYDQHGRPIPSAPAESIPDRPLERPDPGSSGVASPAAESEPGSPLPPLPPTPPEAVPPAAPATPAAPAGPGPSPAGPGSPLPPQPPSPPPADDDAYAAPAVSSGDPLAR